MSESQRRDKRPWWFLGTSPVGAVVLTVIWGISPVGQFIGRRSQGQAFDWFDTALVVGFLLFVVAGIASIVYIARNPDAVDASGQYAKHPQENDPRQQ